MKKITGELVRVKTTVSATMTATVCKLRTYTEGFFSSCPFRANGQSDFAQRNIMFTYIAHVTYGIVIIVLLLLRSLHSATLPFVNVTLVRGVHRQLSSANARHTDIPARFSREVSRTSVCAVTLLEYCNRYSRVFSTQT